MPWQAATQSDAGPEDYCLICNRACHKPVLLPGQRALILAALAGHNPPARASSLSDSARTVYPDVDLLLLDERLPWPLFYSGLFYARNLKYPLWISNHQHQQRRGQQVENPGQDHDQPRHRAFLAAHFPGTTDTRPVRTRRVATTLKPCSAKYLAVAAPTPLELPVINMVFFMWIPFQKSDQSERETTSV